MIEFTPNEPYAVGFLPTFFDENDPRSARAQADTAYQHGGGWIPFAGFTLHGWPDEPKLMLQYPGDPPTYEIARAKLRDETIVLFEHAWVAIIQPDGSYEIARMD